MPDADAKGAEQQAGSAVPATPEAAPAADAAKKEVVLTEPTFKELMDKVHAEFKDAIPGAGPLAPKPGAGAEPPQRS